MSNPCDTGMCDVSKCNEEDCTSLKYLFNKAYVSEVKSTICPFNVNNLINFLEISG